jgi:hypothetical protein
MSRTVTIYCLDVSEGMNQMIADPSTGEEVRKIDLGKEYIQRKLAPKVCNQRAQAPGHINSPRSIGSSRKEDRTCGCDYLWRR